MMREVIRCPKCRGFNGSHDLKTNKFNCKDCEYNGSNKKIEWNQYIEELNNEKKRNSNER